MKILVTGGAGYIGSHACKLLAQHGHEPIVYDNLSRGNKWAVKWGPLEIGDILDKDKLDAVLKKYKPEAVMHFAALAYVGESVREPMLYYKNNVAGSINLLEAVIENGIRKFIFSSTCATYGIPNEIPITENHPQSPINPYGNSKMMIEKILKDYSQAGLIDYVALRYFNAAGADPEGEIGEMHDPETHLIPQIIYNALGITDSIKIFGTDYPTKDGTCVRDYIHVSDLADAHLRALDFLDHHNGGYAFNLGNKKGYSIKEVLRVVKDLSNEKLKIIEENRRDGDPPVLVGDYKLAKSRLKWEPKYNLKTIIETAWKWYSINTTQTYTTQ